MIPKNSWWFITGRVDGADEDSYGIYRAADKDAAEKLFEKELSDIAADNGDPLDPDVSPIYIMYVVNCGTRKPRVVRDAIFGDVPDTQKQT